MFHVNTDGQPAANLGGGERGDSTLLQHSAGKSHRISRSSVFMAQHDIIESCFTCNCMSQSHRPVLATKARHPHRAASGQSLYTLIYKGTPLGTVLAVLFPQYPCLDARGISREITTSDGFIRIGHTIIGV